MLFNTELLTAITRAFFYSSFQGPDFSCSINSCALSGVRFNPLIFLSQTATNWVTASLAMSGPCISINLICGLFPSHPKPAVHWLPCYINLDQNHSSRNPEELFGTMPLIQKSRHHNHRALKLVRVVCTLRN